MDVILLEKVQNLGDLGDKVQVKAGFGRNFLVPYGKAVPATKENVAKFEARRAELEKAAQEKLAEARTRAEALTGLRVEIVAKTADDEGKLFGSVGSREIMDAVAKAGADVEKSEIHLPNGPIRNVGEFNIEIQVHSDVLTEIAVVVVAEA